MATRRSMVVASALTTMAGLLGMGFVALRLGVLDGDGDDADDGRDSGGTPAERGGDPGSTSDPGDGNRNGTGNGDGVRIGYLTLANFHSEPLAVGVTVDRGGETVYEERFRLPAGESSDGAGSGTSVRVGSWNRVGRYVVTLTLPDGERRVDLSAEGLRECAGVFAAVEGPDSASVLVNECEEDGRAKNLGESE